jgi:uncharacterized protein YndB with AHSA1/START domain
VNRAATELRLERTYAASPDRVWRAWTTPEGLAAWWWTHWEDVTYAVDARVGGAYRILAAGAGIGVEGELVEVDEPHRLAFTWVWLEDGAPGPVERVEVTLTPTDAGGTHLALRHTGPWSTGEEAENYRLGWDGVLDALARLG